MNKEMGDKKSGIFMALVILSITLSVFALVLPGPIGLQGEQGWPGVQGPQGLTGPQGPAGQDAPIQEAFIWGTGRVLCLGSFVAVSVRYVNIGDEIAFDVRVKYLLDAYDGAYGVQRQGIIEDGLARPMENNLVGEYVQPSLWCWEVEYASVSVTFDWN